MQDLPKSPGGGGTSLALRLGLVAREHRLRQLQIPVTEGMPDKMVERRRRLIEAEGGDGVGHILSDTANGGTYRTIESLIGACRFEGLVRQAASHLTKTRSVPQLGCKIAITFDTGFREL